MDNLEKKKINKKNILVGNFVDVGSLNGYVFRKKTVPIGTILGYGGIYPIVHKKLTVKL